MISPLPSYDDELLNSAYANISLIADEVWTYDPEDPFRKLNHSLWIQVRRATHTQILSFDVLYVKEKKIVSKFSTHSLYIYIEDKKNTIHPFFVAQSIIITSLIKLTNILYIYISYIENNKNTVE